MYPPSVTVRVRGREQDGGEAAVQQQQPDRLEHQQRVQRDYSAIFLCELRISSHQSRVIVERQIKTFLLSWIWRLSAKLFYLELNSTLSSA